MEFGEPENSDNSEIQRTRHPERQKNTLKFWISEPLIL